MARTKDDLETTIGPLRHTCDLAVLLFLSRYPRTLLTSERLATYVGYDAKQVGRSLETLIGSGVLTCTQNPTHEARLYVFTVGRQHGWVGSLLSMASTLEGRAILIGILKKRGLGQKSERVRKRDGGVRSGGPIRTSRRD
jgi:hypothetical protein